MKTLLITLLFAMTTSLALGVGTAYEKKMKETIETMRSSKTPEEFIKTANTFSMIASTAKEEWLPLYYRAHIYVNLVYMDSEADKDKKAEYLAVARESLDKLLERHAGEVEVQVMESFYWITRINQSGIAAGMIYMGNYTSAIDRALALEPGNPRARFQDLANKIGKAEFFKSDISEYCVEMRKLYETWDEYSAKSELHPTWGKETTKGHLGKCD